MKIGLTIKDAHGTICEKEPYTFDELMEHKGFSREEKKYIQMAPWIAIEWPRGAITMRLEPLGN